jgi:hypothetical protein
MLATRPSAAMTFGRADRHFVHPDAFGDPVAHLGSPNRDLQPSDHFVLALSTTASSSDSLDDDGIVFSAESRGKICDHEHEHDCRLCQAADWHVERAASGGV